MQHCSLPRFRVAALFVLLVPRLFLPPLVILPRRNTVKRLLSGLEMEMGRRVPGLRLGSEKWTWLFYGFSESGDQIYQLQST